jgi:hypothetical protein
MHQLRKTEKPSSSELPSLPSAMPVSRQTDHISSVFRKYTPVLPMPVKSCWYFAMKLPDRIGAKAAGQGIPLKKKPPVKNHRRQNQIN